MLDVRRIIGRKSRHEPTVIPHTIELWPKQLDTAVVSLESGASIPYVLTQVDVIHHGYSGTAHIIAFLLDTMRDYSFRSLVSCWFVKAPFIGCLRSS